MPADCPKERYFFGGVSIVHSLHTAIFHPLDSNMYNVFRNKSLMSLYCRTYHKLVGDLGDDHAKGEQVEAGVVLKQLTGRLLEDDEGQGEDEADV